MAIYSIIDDRKHIQADLGQNYDCKVFFCNVLSVTCLGIIKSIFICFKHDFKKKVFGVLPFVDEKFLINSCN